MSEPVYGYLCGTDFEIELRECPTGARIYPTLEDLKEEAGKCLDECGIVKVRIDLVEWVQEPNKGHHKAK